MKCNKKNCLRVLVILVLAIAVLFLVKRLGGTGFSKQMRIIQKEEDRYRNDTYGGSTPEETLQLFIDALKKGDTDLASKYFVVDKQEEWKEKIDKIREGGKLNFMIEDLIALKKTQSDNDKTSFFILTNKENVVIVQMIISENIFSNKWKIDEL